MLLTHLAHFGLLGGAGGTVTSAIPAYVEDINPMIWLGIVDVFNPAASGGVDNIITEANDNLVDETGGLLLLESGSSIGGETTLYFSSDVYTPSDTPGEFLNVIANPGDYNRNLFTAGRTGGRSQIGGGELVLVNADGGLDQFLEYGYDGRDFSIKVSEIDGLYAATTTFLKGTVEQEHFSWSQVTLRMRDRQLSLDVPIQTVKYAGDNDWPNGVEGTADDIKGKPKPKCFGDVFNVEPVLVNAAKLIYQVHDKRIEGIGAVRDRGETLGVGIQRATLQELLDNTPANGTFDYYYGSSSDGAYLRVNLVPQKIRCDVLGDKSDGTYRSTVSDIVKHLATTLGGIPATEVNETDFMDLNTANSSTVGVWIVEETTIGQVIDELCASIGAWWRFDRLGIMRVARFGAATTPVRTMRRFADGEPAAQSDIDMLNIERVQSNDPGNGLPVYLVKIRYKRNWAKQEGGDFADAVPLSLQSLYSQEWREVIARDDSVKVQHPLAVELIIDTALATETAAQTEATRLLNLYKSKRKNYVVTASLTADIITNVDLATEVQIVADRFGLSGGANGVIVSIEELTATRKATMTVWV